MRKLPSTKPLSCFGQSRSTKPWLIPCMNTAHSELARGSPQASLVRLIRQWREFTTA